MAVKKEYKKPAMVKTGVVLEGVVRFSSLKDGTRPPNTDAPLAYNIVIAVEEDSETAKLIEMLTKEAIMMEKALVPAIKRREISEAVSPLKVDVDKNKEPTGLLRVTLKKRSEDKNGNKLPAPEILDANNNPVDRSFIKSGSLVQVQVRAESYITSAAGLTFKLERVKIIEEVVSTFDGHSPVSPSVFGAPVSSEDDSVL